MLLGLGLLKLSLLIAGANFSLQAPICSRIMFKVEPTKEIFKQGEEVRLRFSIRNKCKHPIFVSRLKSLEFVDLQVIGPDGTEIEWASSEPLVSKRYQAEDFVVLKRGESVTSILTVSFEGRKGFLFRNLGAYRVVADYSLGPPEYFTPVAGSNAIPEGSFPSKPAIFCIESCK